MAYFIMIQTRITTIRQRLAEWQVDGILIINDMDRRWLSGFTGSAGALLITNNKALLATDFRYWTQAEQQAPNYELFKIIKREEGLQDLVRHAQTGNGIFRLGIEANHITVAQFDALEEMKGISWIKLPESVVKMRQIKIESELACIRKAARLGDQAAAMFPQLAKPGKTEKQLAWELEKVMRESGADAVAFDIIVAAGVNSALAHHRPSFRELQMGDCIVVDLGAKVDGYHSDLTRSFHLGSEPSDEFWQVYNLVLRAQEAALAGINAGITGKTVDAIARDIINAAGHEEHFGHSLGHGVGLQIHEEPRFSKVNEDPIPAGAVVTVEPGVYIPNWGGVRIEDLVLVHETGVERLSQAPKEPVIYA
jgi:Xaa-Pro aminopeptidase